MIFSGKLQSLVDRAKHVADTTTKVSKMIIDLSTAPRTQIFGPFAFSILPPQEIGGMKSPPQWVLWVGNSGPLCITSSERSARYIGLCMALGAARAPAVLDPPDIDENEVMTALKRHWAENNDIAAERDTPAPAKRN